MSLNKIDYAMQTISDGNSTETKQINATPADYKERLEIVLQATKTCVFEVDLQRQLYLSFDNAQAIFGVSGDVILKAVQPYSSLDPAEYQAKVSAYFSHPDDAAEIDRAFKCILKGKPATYCARMKAGASPFIWCKIKVIPVLENNCPVRIIGVVMDINDVKTKTESLEDKSKRDAFTGLYNKQASKEIISQALAENFDQKHALIFFDLDNFKEINDKYGHTVGDEVLQDTAKSLQQVFRKMDIIGRFGGDEFIVLVKNIPNRDFLIEKLKGLLEVDDNQYGVTKSAGVAFFPQDASSFSQLLKKADKALYKAKKLKNTYKLYAYADIEA